MEAIAADPRTLVVTLGQQGKHWRDIASEAGVNANTVRTWLRRAGVRINRPDSTENVVVRAEKRKDAPNEDHSSVVRNRLGKALVKCTEALERIPTPKSALAARTLANTIKEIADPAKSVFAWSESQGNVAVSVSLLSTAQVVRPETPAIEVSGVITDVPSPGQVSALPTVGSQDGTTLAPTPDVQDVPGAVRER